ncbi:glycoside hydrolase family 2 protein [Thalassotalea agariperforans]
MFSKTLVKNNNLSTLVLIIFSLFISACGVVQNQSRQNDNPLSLSTKGVTTQTQSLAGQWSFKIDRYNVGHKEQWWAQNLNVEHWDQIKVPGVWDVYDQYHDYTGTAWYRYQFDSKKIAGLDKVQLNFDSVYHDSEVWLNGTKLGENNLGFMAFKFDVSKHLKTTEKNTLVVKVNNRVKRGAVWNWGGIRFPVYLTYQPKTHLEQVYVTATPNLKQGNAKLSIRTKINTDKADLNNAEVELDISYNNKNIYQQRFSAHKAIIDENNHFNITHNLSLNKEQVTLWHFNDPNLYNIKATLVLNGNKHHQINDRFGIRKVETKNNALYLNGEKIRLNGFNMVPEDRFDGNSLPLSRIKEDVDLLKTLNGNFARLSGPALPKAYLDYLDEVGFLLIEEVGLWGKDKLVDPDHPMPKEWLKRLVNDHYNHPSIIGWSVGNEIGDLDKNPKALEYVEGAIKHSKQLDPTRLAVYISYSADFQANDPTMYSDIVMFNKYNDHEERLKVVHNYHPEKAIFFSEIGTKLDGVDPNESTLDPQSLWNGLKKHPYLIGTSHFAFSDYRSDWKDEKPTWTTDYSENRAWGVLTSYRTPKRAFDKLKNFNAPVEELKLKQISNNNFEVSLQPKSTNTFPAFVMRNYQIAWLAKNEQGEIKDAGTIDLPTITPGDNELINRFKVTQSFDKLSVHLLDPFGYIVKQADIFQALPKAPVIKSIFTSLDIIRVTYDKTDMATEYQLEVIDSAGKKILGKKTINNFAEIANLEKNQAYQLKLTAINPLGESNNSSFQPVATTPAELPPVVWSIAAKDDAFHIGFSVHRKDFKYEIQYGLAPGDYTKSFLIDTHGATRIPALAQGKDHYFRLRRLVTGSVDSEWTDEYKVIMPTSKGLRAPNDAVLFSSTEGAILALTPIQGATNYRLKWQQNNITQTLDTNLAYSPLIALKKLSLQNIGSVSIATIDNNGKVGSYTNVKMIK